MTGVEEVCCSSGPTGRFASELVVVIAVVGRSAVMAVVASVVDACGSTVGVGCRRDIALFIVRGHPKVGQRELPTSAAPALVGRQVQQHSAQPGSWVLHGSHARPIVVGPHHCLVGDIVRMFDAPHQRESAGNQSLVVLRKNSSKSMV